MRSAFYEGSVRHRRTAEIDHNFDVPLFMVYLCLDELPEVLGDIPGWSVKGPALARFDRDDHFGDTAESLTTSVRNTVEEREGFRPRGRVCLLTHLRYFGYLFNPVSFFYCFGKDDELCAVLAEVHNTPWHEEHVYSMSIDQSMRSSGTYRTRLNKDFHVSPFHPMDQYYLLRCTDPDEELMVSIKSYKNDNRQLSAGLKMSRKEFNRKNAYSCMLRYPFMTLQVTARIYFEALRLWWKGATFYPHPEGVNP